MGINLFVTSFLLLCFVFLVNAKISKNNGIVRIPLVRMETGLEKLLNRGADLKLIERIYDMCRHAGKPSRLMVQNGKTIPTNDTLPLFKYFDTQYYGLVNIGKPGRQFKMIMDTAWAFSWVISEDCPRASIGCVGHTRYNHRQSSTYVQDNRPFNVSNQYLGYLSEDVFLVGQMNSTNQTFAEVVHLPWIFGLYTTDGTIGLGFKELSPEVTPFFYNFLAQNRLSQPIFSFYVNRDPTTKRGGSLFFGGIDTKHNKSEFTTINVNSKYYWGFSMQKVSLVMSKKSRIDYCKNGCSALADTSSNTITGPADEINEINRLIGAEEIFFSNRYMIPCANEYKGPKVVFTINNQEFQIKAQDYIQKLSYSGITICLSAFQPADPKYTANTWNLGGAFLYRFYTAYDVIGRKIMIAEAA